MKTFTLFVAGAALTLVGCGNGTDRPAPTGAVIQAENDKRKESIANNQAMPPQARAAAQASIDSGKH